MEPVEPRLDMFVTFRKEETMPSAKSPAQLLEESIAESRKRLEKERLLPPAEIKKANAIRTRKIERHLRPATLPVGIRF